MSALTNPVPAPSETPLKSAPVPVPAPKEPEKGSRKWLIFAAIVVVIGGAVGYEYWAKLAARNAAPVVAVKSVKAFTAPMEINLRMAGQTSARNFVNVVTPILRGPEARGSMTLLKLVKSGAHVKKGELIAQIDAQSVEDHIDDLKDTLAAAANDVKKRKAEQSVEWEGMQQTLRVAKSAFDKAALDFQAAEVKTDIEQQLLKIARDEAAARYKQLQGDVALRRQSQASEMRILEITLERHNRHINRHKHDLEKFTIYAPMDGLAVMNTVFRGGEMGQIQEGDQVAPGQPILKIVDPKSMQVEASVSQSDSGELRLSQPVKIGLDAFGDLRFTGRVYSIGALAVGGWRQNNFVRTVAVRVAIDGADPKLIPDLSAHADVAIDSVQDQLQIPLAAVQEKDGKPFVSVRVGDGFTERPVTLGKHNNTYVAVASGLKAGDEVRIN